MGSGNSTKELKRTLGFGDLLGTAIGQIIGAGIMTMTGIAIGITGRSVPISFILAAFMVCVAGIPVVILGGTVRMRGGFYTMVGMLVGKRPACVYIVMYIMQNVAIAMYAFSFADYFLAFVPFNRQLTALFVLTVVYILNMLGTSVAVKFQKAIVVIMCISLGLFAVFGMTKLDPNYFDETFMTGGVFGVLQAASVLGSACAGGTMIISLSAEAKNPKRDIPIVIVLSTVIVGILYAFIGLVACGVLPVSEVAFQSLGKVAETVLPRALYVFFMVGGGMFAILSTLNSQMSFAPKPIMQACEDGWFPRALTKLNRFKVPFIPLTIIYVVGVLAIVLNIRIDIISTISGMVTQFTVMIMNLFLVRIVTIAPKAWEKSKFKISKAGLIGVTILTTAFSMVSFYALLSYNGPKVIAIACCVFAGGIIYSILRFRTGKVTMEDSFEDE